MSHVVLKNSDEKTELNKVCKKALQNLQNERVNQQNIVINDNDKLKLQYYATNRLFRFFKKKPKDHPNMYDIDDEYYLKIRWAWMEAQSFACEDEEIIFSMMLGLRLTSSELIIDLDDLSCITSWL